MSLSIDVVLVVYNQYDLTDSCLRHLAAQTREHRVIVVEHGSTDDSRASLKRDWAQHTLIEIDVNGPLSAATNRGVTAGTGDVIVWINNDVDARPDFLEKLVAPLEADPAAGSVASLMLQPGGDVIDSMGLTADVTLAGFPRLQWQPAANATAAEPVLVGPSGTAAAYRRSAWDAVGALDENITAYSEDLDLALRLRGAGWAAAAAPDAIGTHLGSTTYGHRSSRQRTHGGFSRGYLLRRYGVLRGRVGVRALVTEALVCGGDLVISKDLEATKGRLRGWHAARGLPRHEAPPLAALDRAMSFRDSIALRRAVYALPR
ncbi:MAG: N-acetylglucosaminyl-diphospho-decaprenol L-rhamnosyltransferase [Solirubrobacteraceae bacterium]|jgi:GT2 family glycosyltransferase|nr:N-acetylglucosaminyl-diphospho-decaprenol L-rhamnosyltransferase [Solirubrobacteraceae bacterium]